MSEEISIEDKIAILQKELLEVDKIRDEIGTKIEELQGADAKMGTLTEAFITHIHTLEKHQEAQPELI